MSAVISKRKKALDGLTEKGKVYPLRDAVKIEGSGVPSTKGTL